VVNEVARLMAEERMTQAEVADELKMSERWVNQLWHEARTAALRGDLSSERACPQKVGKVIDATNTTTSM
jgi:transcriptional regulator with XRE-family HTH domain